MTESTTPPPGKNEETLKGLIKAHIAKGGDKKGLFDGLLKMDILKDVALEAEKDGRLPDIMADFAFLGMTFTQQQVLEKLIAPAKTKGKTSKVPAQPGMMPGEIVYVLGMEKFLMRGPGGQFDAEKPIGKDGIFRYLVNRCSIESDEANGFIEQACHRVVDAVDCNPGAGEEFTDDRGRTCINSWRPSEVVPAQGDWPVLSTMLLTLTREDPDAALWVFNWCAAKVQNPGQPSRVAPVFNGPEGNGKTTLGRAIGLVLGTSSFAQISGTDLKDQFNSQYAMKPFVIASDAFVGKEKLELGEKLKPYLTDNFVTLSTPHAKRVLITNRMSMWFTTNKDDGIKLSDGDRRYSLFVSDAEAMTDSYKALLEGRFEPGTGKLTATAEAELAALAYDLHNWDVDWKAAGRPYDNEARRERQIASRAPHEQFFAEVDDPEGQGILGLIEDHERSLREEEREQMPQWDFSGEGIAVAAIYAAYVHFTEKSCAGRALGSNRFGEEWKRHFGRKYPRARRSTVPRVYIIENLPRSQSPGGLLEVAVATGLGLATEDQLLRALATKIKDGSGTPDFSNDADGAARVGVYTDEEALGAARAAVAAEVAAEVVAEKAAAKVSAERREREVMKETARVAAAKAEMDAAVVRAAMIRGAKRAAKASAWGAARMKKRDEVTEVTAEVRAAQAKAAKEEAEEKAVSDLVGDEKPS